jgi:hypothetical protein
VIVIGERHLRDLLKSYQKYYNEARTHLSARRSPAPSRVSVRRWPSQFWADCTINISEREFPTGTGVRHAVMSQVCDAQRTRISLQF